MTYLKVPAEKIKETNVDINQLDKAGKYLCEGEVVTIPWGKSRAVVG